MELAVLMNNKAPGTTLLGELVVAANSGQTLEQIAGTLAARAEFKAEYPLHQTPEEFGAEWIGNILPEADAALKAECVKIVEAHINGGGSVPALVVSVQQFLSDSANAAGDLKVHIDNFSNKVAVATYHTITQELAEEWSIPASVSSDAASVSTGKGSVDTAITVATAASAKTLSLTTGVDALNGGSGDDTFNGVVQGAGALGTTASAGDVVTGGEGTDTLNISVAGNAVHTLQAVQTNGVENVLVTNFDLNAGDTTIDTSLMNGLSKIGLFSSNATGHTVFTGMTAITDAQMGNGSSNLTLTYAGGTTGTADTQNLSLSGTKAGTFTANGLETVAVSGSLAANKLTNIAGSTLTKISVSGDQNFTMSGTSAVKTIDAGASTGKTSLILGAANQTVTLGSGDDTIDIGGNLTWQDKIQGGAGTDTIKITTAGTINGPATATDITSEFLQSGGFEVIDIASTNDAATLALAKLSGVETVKAAANALTVVLDANAGDTAKATNSVAITGTLNGNAITTAAQDGSATSGEAALLLKTQIDAITGFSAAVTGATIVITNNSSSERVDFALTAGHTAADSQAYSDLTVSGMTTQALDVYTADKVTARLADSSGTSDAMSINLKSMTADRSAAQTVTEIDIADSVETLNLNATGMKTGTAAVQKTVSTLTADNSLTTLNISGSDKLALTTLTAAKLATIDGGTHTGDLTIGSSAASLAQTITTGSGNDTITMGANLTAADVIDGGGNAVTAAGTTGKDKLTATGNQGSAVTAAALQISNVETVEIATGGAAASYIDGSKLSGVSSMAFSSTSGSVTLSNMPAGVGLGLGIGAGESTSTYTYTLADATGTEDALTLSYPSGVDASTSNTIVTSGMETLNIVASTEATNAETSTLVLTNAKVSTINVTKGHANDTLALGTLPKTVTTLDAGAAKNVITATGGAVGMTVTLPAAVANTVTTSTKADTVTVKGSLGTVIQVLAGGATATAAASDTVNVTLSSTASDFTSISGFEVVNATIKAATATGFDDATKNNGVENASVVNILGGNANSSFTIDATAKLDRDKTSAALAQTLDASTFAGNIDINYGTDDLDAYTTVKGGASTSDKVTTTISAAAGATENKPTMSGVERLVINSTNTDTDAVINLANATGITRIDATFATAGAADQIEIDSAPVGVPVYATGTNATDNLDVGLASVSGSDDSLTIVSIANNAGLNLDAAGVETLNITGVAANATYDLAGVSPTTGSATTVNLTGAGNVAFSALHTGISTINAASLAGTLTVSAAARDTDAYTITGGVNNDSIAMENAADVLTGGTQAVLGSDTLVVAYTGILGGITADLSAADQVVTMDGSTNTAVQTGFENIDVRAYASFGAVITGSDGANVITGTPLADRINAGKGNDTIQVALTNDANTDQINGGAGSDTFSILAGNYTPAADSNLQAVEIVSSAVTSTIDLSSQTEALTVSGGDNVQTITTGTGADTIALNASTETAAADIVNVNVTTSVGDTITGFDSAGGTNDKLHVDISTFEGANVLIASTTIDLVEIHDNNSVADANGTPAAMGVQVLTAAATAADAKNFFVIDGGGTTYANAAAAVDALEAGGGFALTFNGNIAADDGFLFAYENDAGGTTIAIANFAAADNNGGGAAATGVGNLEGVDILTLAGMADATVLAAAEMFWN